MNVQNEALNADDLTSYQVSAKAGELIFKEHDTGADMFIIRSGRVELLKEYAGQERQIAQLEVGDFFGEMSLLEDQTREVSARAAGPVELLRIDASTFDRIVQEAPEIPVRMLRKLARRLRDYQEHDARAAAIAMGPMAGTGNAAEAGVRRRFAPHQLRHAHAVELAREGVSLNVIQRQLGHSNLGTTSIYLQGIDIEEIISTVHARRAPMMSATAGLRL